MSDNPHKRRSFWIMLAIQFAMYLFTTLFFIIAAVWALPSAFLLFAEFPRPWRLSYEFYLFSYGLISPLIHYWYLFVPLSFLGYAFNVALLYGLGCLPDKVRWFSLAWFVFGLVMMVFFILFIVWMVAYPQWFLNSSY